MIAPSAVYEMTGSCKAISPADVRVGGRGAGPGVSALGSAFPGVAIVSGARENCKRDVHAGILPRARRECQALSRTSAGELVRRHVQSACNRLVYLPTRAGVDAVVRLARDRAFGGIRRAA